MRPSKMTKKQNLPLLKCNRCDFSTKNRYIYMRHKNRCSRVDIPGLRKNYKAAVAALEKETSSSVGDDRLDASQDESYVDLEESVREEEEPVTMEPSGNSDEDVVAEDEVPEDSKPLRAAPTSKMPKIKLKFGGRSQTVVRSQTASRGQPKRNYSCEECNFKTTKSKVYLYHHINKHGASFNIFPCTMCDYGCRWKHKLLRHMKMVHHCTPNSDDVKAEVLRSPTKKSPEGSKYASRAQSGSKQPPAKKAVAVKKVYKKQVPLTIKLGDKTVALEYILDLSKKESSPHFKCKLCLYSSTMKARVFNHVMACHINAKQFQCKLCNFATTKKTDFYAHKARHGSQKIFSCPDCAYTTAFKPNFDRHRINHQRQFRFKCMFCSYTSDHEGALKRHVMYSHPDSQQETEALLSTSIKESPIKDIDDEDDDDDNMADDDEDDEQLELLPGFERCEYCGFLGMSDEELEEHVSSHKRTAFYPCQICKLRYKRSGDLNRHMKLKHDLRLKDFIRRQGTAYQIEISVSGEITVPSTTGAKPKVIKGNNSFPDMNDNAFSTQDDDDNEIQFRSPSEDQPLDLSMSSPEKTPSKAGVDPENLQCADCAYVAKWPSDLRRHSVVHTVEKKFKCKYCQRKYKYAGDLNVHLRRDHKIEPDSTKVEKPMPSPKRKPGMFKCPTCPYTSPFRSEVERHARSHTESKPHNCILCDYQSHWKGDVKRHIQKHHPEVLESTVPVEEFIETSVEGETSCDKKVSPNSKKTPVPAKEVSPVTSSPQTEAKQPSDGQDTDDSSKEQIFKCKYCEFFATAPSKLKAHVITHVNLKQWKCPVCPRRSNWKWDIRKHIIKDHPKHVGSEVIMLTEEEAKATIQDYISKSTMPKRENHLDNMNIAEAQDELKFPYRCSACGYNSAYRWEVSKHIRMNHPGQNCSVLVAFSTTDEDTGGISPAKEPSPKMELKKMLKQPTLKQTTLKRHLAQEDDDGMSENGRKRTRSKKADEDLESRPFMCGECGKRCSSNGDVKKHYHYIHPEKEIQVIFLGNNPSSTPEPPSPSQSKGGKKPSYQARYSNPKLLGYIKPFKCSVCHRRSNWKWDINKHMRESHVGVPSHLIILSEEEARATLPSYVPPTQQQALQRAKLAQQASSGSQDRNEEVSKTQASESPSPAKQQVYRNLKQFKCSMCNYRSDWRSDTLRHIKSKHGRARAVVYTLDPDQARATIGQYLIKRKADRRSLFFKSASHIQQPQTRRSSTESSSSLSRNDVVRRPPPPPSPKGRIWKCGKCSYSHRERRQVCLHLKTHKLRPFNCKVCGHASNYRSALYRHLRTKHNSNDFSLCHMMMKYAKEGANGVEELAEEDMTMEELEELEAEKDAELVEDEMDELEEKSQSEGKRAFYCKLCEFQTTWRSCVIRHLGERHKSTDFTLCGIKTVELSAVKKKGRKKYNCVKCPYQTEKPGLLKFHMSYHKPQPGNRYKCKYCPYYVCAKRLLHQHLRIHAAAAGKITVGETKPAAITPKRYQCEKCPFKTGSKNDILYHKQFHRPRPSAGFKCDFCDYWVTHRRLLKQHYRMHKAAETPVTPVKQTLTQSVVAPSPCKSEATDASWFYNPVDAASIKQQVISSKITRSLPAPGQSPVKQTTSPAGYVVRNGIFRKLHQCRYCPYVNLRGRNLRLHEKMHGWRLSDKVLYQCTQCNYMVGSKGLLSHHMKVHMKGYGMDPSDDTTAELENLEGVHVEGDENSDRSSEVSDQQHDSRMDTLLEIARFKKYACEKCPYASAKRNHFERHLELHGSKQRYLCDFCDYSVPSNNLLSQHQKLHLLPNQNLLAVQSVSNLQHLPEITADVAVASFLSAYNPEKEKTISVTHDHMELYENHPDPPDEPKKLYRCDRCPYANVRRDHILAHLKFHMVRSELACQYCDYSVSKSHLLTQHIKVHFSPLPEFSEWLAQSGIKDRDRGETPAAVGKADNSDGKEDPKAESETSQGSDEKVVQKPNPSEDEAEGNGKGGDQQTSDGKAAESKPGEDGATDEGGATAAVANSDIYVCQYCDREFITSEQLVCHEMQHLIGNHFEVTKFL